jgi:hypothetical protein
LEEFSVGNNSFEDVLQSNWRHSNDDTALLKSQIVEMDEKAATD